QVGDQFRAGQPTARLLVVRDAQLVVLHPGRASVDHLGTDQAEDAAMLGIDSHNRVHQHTDVLAVAHRAEAPLAGGMFGEVQLGGIRHRQHVPAGRALPGHLAGPGQHLPAADRFVVEELPEPAALLAAPAQHMQAHALVLLHGLQQGIPRGRQATVAEPAELRFRHANRSPAWCEPERIEPAPTWQPPWILAVPDSTSAKLDDADSQEIDSRLPDYRSPWWEGDGGEGPYGRSPGRNARPLPLPPSHKGGDRMQAGAAAWIPQGEGNFSALAYPDAYGA